jgi:hypothetical protein
MCTASAQAPRAAALEQAKRLAPTGDRPQINSLSLH